MQPDQNQSVISAMSDYRRDQSVLAMSKATHISRITLNSWGRGQLPSLGTLLEHYFIGTPAGKLLAYKLILLLNPEVAGRLPIAEK
jgi:hypothetical protein